MALGELGCPSLQYVYDMTWSEFMIRLYSYNRQELRKEMLFREVAYSAYISGWMSKKTPPSKQQFWRIGDDKPNKPTEAMLKRMKEAVEQYHKEVKAKNE